MSPVCTVSCQCEYVCVPFLVINFVFVCQGHQLQTIQRQLTIAYRACLLTYLLTYLEVTLVRVHFINHIFRKRFFHIFNILVTFLTFLKKISLTFFKFSQRNKKRDINSAYILINSNNTASNQKQ